MHNSAWEPTSCRSRSECETSSDLKTKLDCAQNCRHSLLIRTSHCLEKKSSSVLKKHSKHSCKSHNKLPSTASVHSQFNWCKSPSIRGSRKFTVQFKLNKIFQTWRQEEESLKTEWMLNSKRVALSSKVEMKKILFYRNASSKRKKWRILFSPKLKKRRVRRRWPNIKNRWKICVKSSVSELI